MKTLIKCILAVLSITGSVGSPHREAHAQEFPRKVVRIVVPTAEGGSVNFVARLLAAELNKSWSHGVIVDNRPGAGGTIGADIVAKATPDGHTIAHVSSSFTTNAGVYSNLPYDSLRDFEPVTLIAFSPWVLVVSSSLPVLSVKELIAFAKEKPAQITYASTGSGGAIHLATELLNRMAALNMVHVPYKGAAPGLIDMASGRVDVTITGLTGAMPHVKTGKLRLLAVTGANRSPVAPEISTIGESVPGYAYDNWFGVLAPRATPKNIVAQLHDRFTGALQVPEVRQRLVGLGMEPVGSSSAQFGDMIRQEIGKISKLVKDMGGVSVQ